MKYVRLGTTGTKVSRICLGCLSFGGTPTARYPWVLSEEESRPLVSRALELGINYFDTANAYSIGMSEEILGRAIRDFAKREDVVIATKVFNPMRDEPNGRGLSRKAIMNEIDASLRRLGMDYVDLYQTHRWDPETPIEETLEALHDVVKAGKARYIGASSMYAWQFCKALGLSDRHGWSRFVSMQNHYNLIQREDEREMLPLCLEEGIGVLPWSPLARGRLARDAAAVTETNRGRLDFNQDKFYSVTEGEDAEIFNRVGAVAAGHGVPRAQVALAWLLQQPAVTAPIVGATKTSHIDDAVAALDVKLDAANLLKLEEPYSPRAYQGFV